MTKTNEFARYPLTALTVALLLVAWFASVQVGIAVLETTRSTWSAIATALGLIAASGFAAVIVAVREKRRELSHFAKRRVWIVLLLLFLSAAAGIVVAWVALNPGGRASISMAILFIVFVASIVTLSRLILFGGVSEG